MDMLSKKPDGSGSAGMRGWQSLCWAKLRKDPETDTVVSFLSLADHSADVAACCESLLSQPLIRRRFAKLADTNDLTSRQCARLCVLAALHDIGKANVGFQNRKFPHPEFSEGHVQPVLGLFGAESRFTEMLSNSLKIDTIDGWSREDGACRLLIASLCHHGKPVGIGTHVNPRCWKAANGADPFGCIADLVQATRQWYPEAWEERGTDLPSDPAFQHAFCGLVTLSDWLGSDIRFFPLNQTSDAPGKEAGDRISFSRCQAQAVMESIGLSTDRFRSGLGGWRDSFQAIADFLPNPIQREVLNVPIPPDGGITILEAPTGNGKTEAALARFIQMFQAGDVDGVYFALPTRSAATEIHNRVVKAIRKAFPDSEFRPPVTLAVPGYIQVDDRTGHRLPGFEVLWDDDPNRQWRVRGWASEHSKRYLAGSVVVGTIDQVLLSRLMVPHAHMRSFCLFRHLLVIDEVHASDAYMNAILGEVLRWHIRVRGHALLMSATLAGTARQRLLFPDKATLPLSLEKTVQAAYPLISQRSGSHQTEIAVQVPTIRRVHVENHSPENVEKWIAESAVSFAGQGAHVLVIRNRVRDCLETQIAMESGFPKCSGFFFRCHGKASPHHARYAGNDRRALDRALEAEFGKGRPVRGVVCVATQTVQQSLDLDADILITDICPMDVLLQRVGRLHRHSLPARPSGFEIPRVLVVTPPRVDFDSYIHSDGKAGGPSGIGTVYENLCILEATLRMLELNPEIALPDDCRRLVENALHPDTLKSMASEKGEKWERHLQEMEGQYSGMKCLANLNFMNWNAFMGDSESLFPSGELGGKVSTRLGEGDRLVRFPEGIASPFEGRITELSLPAWVCADMPPDAMPRVMETSSERTIFSFGDNFFVYDRLGVRPQQWNITPP
jgi:CRISPR-associated endonuclease/helicase Cas3